MQALGELLGSMPASITRITQRKEIKAGKPQEATILLIRAYRSLFTILGGDIEAMRHWLNTPNKHLGGKPVEHLQTWAGLSDTVYYLDAIRGKAG